MARAEKELLDELKGGTSSFNLTGRVQLSDNSLKGIQQKDGKTWRHVNSNLRVKTDEGNVVMTRIWDGYKTDNPVLKRFSADNDMVDIKWEHRLEESAIEQVRRFDLYRVGLEKQEDGKGLDVKEFISGIDFEEYLQEHLKDDAKITVRGGVEYSEYNGDIQRRYNVKSVFLSEPFTNKDGEEVNPKEHAHLRQVYLVHEDSLERNWEKNLEDKGTTTVSALVPQYVSKVRIGDNWTEIKKTVPYPQAIIVKANTEDEKDLAIKKKVIERFFKVKRDKVRELTLVNDIVEGYEQTTGDVDIEGNEELKELVELGIMTEESIKKQVTIRGNRISEIVYFQPAIKVNKDGDKRLMMDDDKYSTKALINPIEAEDDDLEEDVFEEHEEADELSEDDLDAFFEL